MTGKTSFFAVIYFNFGLNYNLFVSDESITYPPTFIIRAVQLIGLVISKILWGIKFRGLENIPQNLESGLIIVSNHQTYFDPFWICLKVRRKFRFMAWDKAFEWFLIGRFIRYLGAFPVSLERGGTVKTMKQTLASLRDGATLVIFPEGSREFSDGNFLKFKTGAARLAIEANVPILPVTVRGGNQIWAQNMEFPRLGSVEIIYHPLLKVSPPESNADVHLYANALTEKLVEIIGSE